LNRSDIIDLLDGTHEAFGRRVALILHGIIILSAFAIALETLRDLPAGLRLALQYFEFFVLAVFVAEYLLRLTCSERPLRYAFSLWGIVDLLACLPALALLQPQWQAVRTLRLIRLVRLLKLFRSSSALDRLTRAFLEVRGELAVFLILASLVLYVSAVGIYIFEHDAQPEAFSSIPKSLWWAVASFTTVGYGDLYPITTGGRIFTAFVLFIGLGVVAVPAAIVTTALLETQSTPKPLERPKHKISAETTKEGDST